jgi:hypothetical protein
VTAPSTFPFSGVSGGRGKGVQRLINGNIYITPLSEPKEDNVKMDIDKPLAEADKKTAEAAEALCKMDEGHCQHESATICGASKIHNI